MNQPAATSRLLPVFLTGFLLLCLTAAILLAMGRVPICTCGEVKLWTSDVTSSDNSQHIADWYTPSHVIHGFLFYWFAWLIFPKMAVGWRLILSIIVEAAWEILENSPMVIDRYREATIALGYTGDSVLNSVFDVVWMIAGFALAWRLPVWLTVSIALFFEILTAALIRDNLTLNVVMLLWPIEAIKAWQTGG